MPKVLIVKTSSLGDVIHALPALTDAARALPDGRFHWVAEEALAEIPSWHPAVERVIPIALRRWRRGVNRAWRSGEITGFRDNLLHDEYDLILDAQGLIKSAALAGMARGTRLGFDAISARESLAARFYHRTFSVSRELHAIERLRRLFALALDYPLPCGPPVYGIQILAKKPASERPYLMFFYGTTWQSKHWPEPYWVDLLRLAGAAGYEALLPWGTESEHLQAKRMAAAAEAGRVLPRQDLGALGAIVAAAAGVVGVDSGLSHLAAALDVPAVTLYGASRTSLTGAIGPYQHNLEVEFSCAPCLDRKCKLKGPREVFPPCYSTLPPDLVWDALQRQMAQKATGSPSRA